MAAFFNVLPSVTQRLPFTFPIAYNALLTGKLRAQRVFFPSAATC